MLSSVPKKKKKKEKHLHFLYNCCDVNKLLNDLQLKPTLCNTSFYSLPVSLVPVSVKAALTNRDICSDWSADPIFLWLVRHLENVLEM